MPIALKKKRFKIKVLEKAFTKGYVKKDAFKKCQ